MVKAVTFTSVQMSAGEGNLCTSKEEVASSPLPFLFSLTTLQDFTVQPRDHSWTCASTLPSDYKLFPSNPGPFLTFSLQLEVTISEQLPLISPCLGWLPPYTRILPLLQCLSLCTVIPSRSASPLIKPKILRVRNGPSFPAHNGWIRGSKEGYKISKQI